jgi:hypothetical protein
MQAVQQLLGNRGVSNSDAGEDFVEFQSQLRIHTQYLLCSFKSTDLMPMFNNPLAVPALVVLILAIVAIGNASHGISSFNTFDLLVNSCLLSICARAYIHLSEESKE